MSNKPPPTPGVLREIWGMDLEETLWLLGTIPWLAAWGVAVFWPDSFIWRALFVLAGATGYLAIPAYALVKRWTTVASSVRLISIPVILLINVGLPVSLLVTLWLRNPGQAASG